MIVAAWAALVLYAPGGAFHCAYGEVQSIHRDDWETLSAGYIDEGWRDTVLIMPGEQVKILLKFEDYTGLYLYHCHNLEHEDMGMMRNYRVEA